MKKNEAEILVTDTFTQGYNEERFRLFVHNLFHDYKRLDEKTMAGSYIRDSFKEAILSYKRLAKFTDPDGKIIDVLAVKVPNHRMLENARTLQRNFVAWYLNGGRGGTLRDSALVAFYTDDSDDWRFSLVRMDYILDAEKNKVVKELTPARRYSFLVGKHEKTHTVCKQLIPVLTSPTEITLSQLETAFNIETVTKEFFEKYKGLYISLKNTLDKHLEQDIKTKTEFENKAIKTDDFAKRLLGQIVFLYFLQKKGWLGVERGKSWGTGPKDFLQKLYRKEIIPYTNFFNDVLEHLFYDGLATERQTQDHFFPALNCKIPFLNGGLFESYKGYDWDGTDVLLDNSVFKDIFEVFDLYNFTVREDEPLDKEVAVDPEMLGKVFENLIPENERKGSGTFYTPREIVHYMCQESLINYLDAKLNIQSQPIQTETQQTLFAETIKTDLLTKFEDIYVSIVPRSDIAEFIYHGDVAQEHDATAEAKNQNNENYKGDYQHKIPETIRTNARAIDDALASVKICDPAIGSGAFPVGIMNELVRSRSVLNAYISDGGRTPYDFKRHAIQESIYGVDLEPSAVDIAKLRLWLSLVVDEDDFGNIKPLPNLEYKILSGDSLLGIETKGDLIREQQVGELEKLKTEYFSVTSRSRKDAIKNRVESIISDLTSIHTKNKGTQLNSRFDYRIFFSEVFRENGGFDIVIANPPYGAFFSPKIKKILKSEFPEVPDYESFYYFISLANAVAHCKTTLCYIIPNTFMLNLYAVSFRKDLLNKWNVNQLLDFSNQTVFETAIVQNCVILLNKSSCFSTSCLAKPEILGGKVIQSNPIQKNKDDLLQKIDNWQQFLSFSHEINLIDKLKNDFLKIADIAEVKQGYIPYRKTTLIQRFGNVEGVKILEEKLWHSNKKETNDYKKDLKGKDIERYSVGWSGGYIKYGTWLSTYVDPWFFTGERVLFREITTVLPYSIMAAFTEEELYHNPSVIVAKPKNNKMSGRYILAIANSKLSSFFFFKSAPKANKGVFPKILINDVRNIPIVKPSNEIQEKIISLVKAIEAKNEDKNFVTNTQRQIDLIVYKIFDLSSEEIAIIEEAVK
jgi:hypothetical protein